MITMHMLNKAEMIRLEEGMTVAFMDEIVRDIEVLKIVIAKRRDFLKEEAINNAVEAGNLIKKAREELSNAK